MASNIVPVTQTSEVTISSFVVTCRTLTLFESATFNVDLFDVNGNNIVRKIIELTQEQYLDWNNNDDFIINLVAQQLGFILEP